MALRALERLGARGIFLTGAGQEPLRGLPNHVLQRAYAPLGALLPSCAGLVHPGGIGAMSLALAAGVPQVLLPCAHDQFDHPQTRYIVAMGRQGICGCARLLPTTDAYLLKEVFAYLCSETPPSDPSVWELSRYAASAADDPQLAMKIFWSSLQCAWYLGASSVVAVTTTAMERYFVRNGVILQRLGPPQKVKGETLVAISFPAYQERGLEMLLRYHPEWLQGVPLSMAV
ncbi:nucleotide disphospho-sugar-binding domain-containing protein [Pseudomonas aeruginosa]